MAFNKFKSNGYSGTMVEFEITNNHGDNRSETLEAFINMSGRVKLVAKRYLERTSSSSEGGVF